MARSLRTHHPRCQRRSSYRPVLELLEDRLTPSASVVPSATAIPDQYILTVHQGTDVLGFADELRQSGREIVQVYTHALQAIVVRGEAVDDPRVAAAENDYEVASAAGAFPTGIDRINVELNTTAAIDGVHQELDIDVAIIDTGIDGNHPDLNVHAAGSRNFVRKGRKVNPNAWADDNGHGTHVAGTVAATDDGVNVNGVEVVGVAPGARVWAVKVLNRQGSGFVSDIIAGVDYVTANADQIEIANMSLGLLGQSAALRTAIQNSVNAGVLYTVAAMNNGDDVYGNDGIFGTGDDWAPASYPEVATISALSDTDGQPGGNGSASSWAGADRNGDGIDDGQDDSFAWFSNFSDSVIAANPVTSPGRAIDMILPGVDILSTVPGGYGLASGTSMASPHYAGLAALYMVQNGRANDAAGVYAVRQALINNWSVPQNDALGLTTLNDPDGNLDPIGWAGPLAPITDIAITSVSAPTSAIQGDVVNVNVTVSNVGNQDVTSAIAVTLSDGTDSWTQTLPTGLTAGATTTLTFSWNTTNVSLGSHTLTAGHDVTDDNAGNNSNSTTVTVVEDGNIHIGDLDGTAVNRPGKNRWQASVQVLVHNQADQPLANATVTAIWSGVTSGTVTGVTGNDGTVTFTRNIKGSGNAIFTVTNVTHAVWNYEAAANHDPDGDSNGTAITLSQPGGGGGAGSLSLAPFAEPILADLITPAISTVFRGRILAPTNIDFVLANTELSLGTTFLSQWQQSRPTQTTMTTDVSPAQSRWALDSLFAQDNDIEAEETILTESPSTADELLVPLRDKLTLFAKPAN